MGHPPGAGSFIESVGISTATAAPARRIKRTKATMTRAKIVKWTEKGYGFAKTDSGESVFIHVSELIEGLESLPIGQEVEFTIAADKRDPSRFRATGVKVL